MLSSAGLWYVGGFQREMRKYSLLPRLGRMFGIATRTSVDHALSLDAQTCSGFSASARLFFMDFDSVRQRAIICNMFAAHSRRNGIMGAL